MSRLFQESSEKKQPKRIAFWACKGGAGKSFFAYNLAGIFANEGAKVLYIGFDSQQDVSNKLLAATDEFDPDEHKSLRGVLEGQYPMSEAIYTTQEFRRSIIKSEDGRTRRRFARGRSRTYTFDIVPAGRGLTLISDLQPEDLSAVSDVMKDIEPLYDFIILDLPPSDAASTELALAYADHVFIPVNDSTWDDSIDLCLSKVEELNTTGFHVNLSGIIINMFHAGNELDAYNEKTLREVWKNDVLRTRVPYADAARNALMLGLPLISYPYSTPIVPVLYRLADEIVRRMN